MGIASFATMHALSRHNDDPDHASRPFDATRDGFVMGEGAGILILEDEEYARERGARIYAEMVGYACTADATTSPSLLPAARAWSRAISTRAGERPESRTDEVDYINAHGTATRLQ